VLGRDRLRTLITDVHARLAQMHESSAQGLSPNWKRPAETLGALGGRFPSWAPAALCVIIVILIIVLLNLILSRDISSAQHSLL
jgi:type VI protein secretion system component VasF